MKKKRFARWIALVLCLASALSLAACGDSGEPASVPSETAESAETAAVPDRGAPDRSELKYTEAIEAYRKSDWTGNWIWTEACSEDSYVAFRKTFTLDEAVPSATAFISAADKYVLWINGELTVLDGSLKRGPTPYDSYYDEVEITNLQAGENVVALLAAFNGRSGDGSIMPVIVDEEGDEYPQAGLLFEMKLGNTIIASDASWKAQRHTAYKNRVTGGADYVRYEQSSMLAERNVFFDARDDLGDWTSLGYDDAAWENASLIARPGDLPFGTLYAPIIRPIRFHEVSDCLNAADYLNRELTEDTTLVLELPGNIQFTAYFELEAPAGKKLTFYTDTYTDWENIPNFKDTYITAAGAQRYENYPWRSGSRLIIEAEVGVTFTKLGYRKSEFNGDWVEPFHSSDAALDQLWQESLNTVAICMRDTYMDCPERERGPYMGDASNQIDAALYGYDEGALAMTKKAILACVAWTTDSGAIPSRAPSVKPQEIPNQSLAFMSSAYHYWLHSGDSETMTAYYRAFVDYLKLFEMENGLPKYRAGSWQWNDWGNKIDAELLQADLYYYALNLTRQLAADLAITDDEAFLTERMDSMKAAWREAYTTPEGFRSANSKNVDDRANAMLALSGLADESDYEQICAVLTSTCEASPFTEKYVLEALCVMGRVDLAVQRMLERYDPMLHDEWDTLWEQFNDNVGTYNHGWSAAPLYILSKYVVGVRPTAPGFARYELVLTELLDEYACSVYTPRGELRVEKTGDTVTLTAIDGEGTVILPNCETLSITEAGTYTISLKN